MEDEENFEYEECNLYSLFSIGLSKLEENVSYHVFEDNFPECYILRRENNLIIQLEEHIYTKYWYHKYHAHVFAEAMMKAIKRLRTELFSLKKNSTKRTMFIYLFVGRLKKLLIQPKIL